MSYIIDKEIYKIAHNLGYEVKPSKVKGKKIDVYKDGKKIRSIGAAGHGDYFTYLRKNGPLTAQVKRTQYINRHAKDIDNKNGNGWFSYKLLWKG